MEKGMEQNTLAWHESLELHELTALKSVGLMKLKMGIKNIEDNRLKEIYQKTITEMEMSLHELLQFYPLMPEPGQSSEYRMDTGFYAGDLLALAKTEVRSYAIAITETATPVLRETLRKQLNTAIKCHERIFTYMYEKGMYPSYDLQKLAQHDVMLAKKALTM